MKNLIFISLLLLTFITATDMSSQTKNIFAVKDSWEVGGSFSFSKVRKEFAPYAGYFITDGFELGVIPAVEFINEKNEEDKISYSIFIASAYNGNWESEAYPFIQGAIGYYNLSGERDESGLTMEIEAGLKTNVLGGNTLLKVAADYNHKFVFRLFSSSEEWEGTFGFVAGLSIFFK